MHSMPNRSPDIPISIDAKADSLDGFLNLAIGSKTFTIDIKFEETAQLLGLAETYDCVPMNVVIH